MACHGMPYSTMRKRPCLMVRTPISSVSRGARVVVAVPMSRGRGTKDFQKTAPKT